MERLQRFLSTIDTSECKLAAALTNGDVKIPEWAAISESTDHLKIWDIETGSNQMGFVYVPYEISCDDFDTIECPHCGEEFERVDHGDVSCPHCDGICGN